MPLLIAIFTAVLLSAAALGVASVPGCMSAPAAPSASAPRAATGVAAARAKPRCAECGFVQSVRRVPARGDAPETYEITLRLRDGSTHVHTGATRANWRRGERIIYIAGERPSGE